MSKIDNNTKGQKLKISKWATASMYLAFTGLALILLSLLSVEVLYSAPESVFYIIPEILWAVGLILIIFGFITSIIGLICIKASKEALKGTGRAVVGLLLGLLLITLFLSVTIVGRQVEKIRAENTIKNNK